MLFLRKNSDICLVHKSKIPQEAENVEVVEFLEEQGR